MMKQAIFYSFLLVYMATAAITLGGLAGFLPIQKEYLDKLFIALLAESIPAVIAVYRGARFFSYENDQHAFLKAVSGDWWERARGNEKMPISYLRIYYANNTQPMLTGTTFTHEGAVYAQWRTTAVAILHEKNELFYHWEGNQMDTPNETFSGIGAVRFNDIENISHYGTGWYSLGNINDMKVEGRQLVDLMRMTNEREIDAFRNNPGNCREIVIQALGIR